MAHAAAMHPNYKTVHRPPASLSSSDETTEVDRFKTLIDTLIVARTASDQRIIRLSRLDWTIVRPTVLTDGPRTGAYRVLVDARDWSSGFISRADVADFLVKQINDASLLHKTPALTG